MKFKFTLLTPWTLLPTSLSDEKCEDNEAALFAKLLTERTENEYGRHVFWPTGRGEAFLHNSFNSFENRFLKHSEYALLIVSGENASYLDHIYPRFLVFFTAKQTWSDRIIIVFLKHPKDSYLFDTMDDDKEAWSKIFDLINRRYAPEDQKNYPKYLFTPTEYYTGGWMSVTDLRGQPLAVRITSSSSQTDSIQSSWHDLSTLIPTNTTGCLSYSVEYHIPTNPIEQRLSQSVAEFEHSPTHSRDGSPYLHLHVNNYYNNRNKSLSPRCFSKKHRHYKTICGLNPCFSTSFGSIPHNFDKCTKGKCQIDTTSHYENSLEQDTSVKTDFVSQTRQMCIPRKKLKIRSCEFLADAKPSRNIFGLGRSVNISDGSEYSNNAAPNLSVKHQKKVKRSSRRHYLSNESINHNTPTRKLIKLFKFRRKKDVHIAKEAFGNHSKLELAKAVKTLSNVGQSLADASVGTSKSLKPPEDQYVDTLQQPSCSYYTSVLSIHTQAEQHLNLEINHNNITIGHQVRENGNESFQATPIPSGDFSDSGLWSLSQNPGDDVNNSTQYIVSGSESPVLDFIDNQCNSLQTNEIQLQKSVTSPIKPVDLEVVNLFPCSLKSQQHTELILIKPTSHSAAYSMIEGELTSTNKIISGKETSEQDDSVTNSSKKENFNPEVTVEHEDNKLLIHPESELELHAKAQENDLHNPISQLPLPNLKPVSCSFREDDDKSSTSQILESNYTFFPETSLSNLDLSQRVYDNPKPFNKIPSQDVTYALSNISTFEQNLSVSPFINRDILDERTELNSKPTEVKVHKVTPPYPEPKSEVLPTHEMLQKSSPKLLSSDTGHMYELSSIQRKASSENTLQFKQSIMSTSTDGSFVKTALDPITSSEITEKKDSNGAKPNAELGQNLTSFEVSELHLPSSSKILHVDANLLEHANFQENDNSHHSSDVPSGKSQNDIHLNLDSGENNIKFNRQNFIRLAAGSEHRSSSPPLIVSDNNVIDNTHLLKVSSEKLSNAEEHSVDSVESNICEVKVTESSSAEEISGHLNTIPVVVSITDRSSNQFRRVKNPDALSLKDNIDSVIRSSMQLDNNIIDAFRNNLDVSEMSTKTLNDNENQTIDPVIDQLLVIEGVLPKETDDYSTILTSEIKISFNSLHTLGVYQKEDSFLANSGPDKCGPAKDRELQNVSNESAGMLVTTNQPSNLESCSSITGLWDMETCDDKSKQFQSTSDTLAIKTLRDTNSFNEQSLVQTVAELSTESHDATTDSSENNTHSNKISSETVNSCRELAVGVQVKKVNLIKGCSVDQKDEYMTTTENSIKARKSSLSQLSTGDKSQNEDFPEVSNVYRKDNTIAKKELQYLPISLIPEQMDTLHSSKVITLNSSFTKSNDYTSPECTLEKQICDDDDEHLPLLTNKTVENFEETVKKQNVFHESQQDAENSSDVNINTPSDNSLSIISVVTIPTAQCQASLVDVSSRKEGVFESGSYVKNFSSPINLLEQSDVLHTLVGHETHYPISNVNRVESKGTADHLSLLYRKDVITDRSNNQLSVKNKNSQESEQSPPEIPAVTLCDKKSSSLKNSVNLFMVNAAEMSTFDQSTVDKLHENDCSESGILSDDKTKSLLFEHDANTMTRSDVSDNIETDFKNSLSTPPPSWDSERSDYSNITNSSSIYLNDSEVSLQMPVSALNSSLQLEDYINFTDNTTYRINHRLHDTEIGKQTVKSILVNENTEDVEQILAILSPLQDLSPSKASTETMNKEGNLIHTTNQICIDENYILRLSENNGSNADILNLEKQSNENSDTSISRGRCIFTEQPYNILMSFFHLATLYVPRHVYWLYGATFTPREQFHQIMAGRRMHISVFGLRDPISVAGVFIGVALVSPYLRTWPHLLSDFLSSSEVSLLRPFYWVDRPILEHIGCLLYTLPSSIRWGSTVIISSFRQYPWSLANPSAKLSSST
ncbi:unnamed protein product [Heterobilharzia americana]|nr:unnamed protein product [Heterobilharzia americana]